MKKALKSLAICKSEYLGSNPEFFVGQVGSGSNSQSKMGSGSIKISFGSTTLMRGIPKAVRVRLCD
jgi:hypothetical protein